MANTPFANSESDDYTLNQLAAAVKTVRNRSPSDQRAWNTGTVPKREAHSLEHVDRYLAGVCRVAWEFHGVDGLHSFDAGPTAMRGKWTGASTESKSPTNRITSRGTDVTTAGSVQGHSMLRGFYAPKKGSASDSTFISRWNCYWRAGSCGNWAWYRACPCPFEWEFAVAEIQRPGSPPMLGSRFWEVRVVSRPRRCLEYEKNLPAHSGELDLINIRWRDSGKPISAADGANHFCYTGVCGRRPVRLVATGLTTACGRRLYTKLRVQFPPSNDLPASMVVITPPACGGAIADTARKATAPTVLQPPTQCSVGNLPLYQSNLLVRNMACQPAIQAVRAGHYADRAASGFSTPGFSAAPRPRKPLTEWALGSAALGMAVSSTSTLRPRSRSRRRLHPRPSVRKMRGCLQAYTT